MSHLCSIAVFYANYLCIFHAALLCSGLLLLYSFLCIMIVCMERRRQHITVKGYSYVLFLLSV